jgi:CheY-like chemotaxis protein
VVLNLCTNAEFAMREKGGVLTVSLAEAVIQPGANLEWPSLPAGRWAHLKISDTGMGMDNAVQERVFEPYFTTKKPNEGTGLGLATVHGIVANHRGHIFLESEPGLGTSISIFLPIVSREEEKGDLSEEGRREIRGKGQILVIDDEKSITDVATKALSRYGFEVTALQDGIRALEIFRAAPFSFDLVLTDQTMPNITGFELAAQMLSIRPDLPIILTTGYSGQVTAEQAKEAGIRLFLEKPLKLRELAGAVDSLLTNPTTTRG